MFSESGYGCDEIKAVNMVLADQGVVNSHGQTRKQTIVVTTVDLLYYRKRWKHGIVGSWICYIVLQ
jgi:hypothetical protein